MNDEEVSQDQPRMSWFGVVITLISIFLINIAVFSFIGNSLRYTPFGLLGSGAAGLTMSGGVSFVISTLVFLSVRNVPKIRDEEEWRIFLSIFISTLIYTSVIMWGLLLLAKFMFSH